MQVVMMPRWPIKDMADTYHDCGAVCFAVAGTEYNGRCIRYHGVRLACSNGSARASYRLEERNMSIMTPNAKGHEHLGALASRYVDVASLPWVPTRFAGVDLKVLMEDKETGLMTA